MENLNKENDELIIQYPDYGLTPSEVMLLEQHRKMVEESDMYATEKIKRKI